MTRKLEGKEDSPKKSPEEKIRETDLALNNTPRKTREKKDHREKLDKNGLLKLMKKMGKESIDPDHEALIKYIFPKNELTPQENRNKNYTRKRIKTALDLILAYCEVYPKKGVKKT